MTPPPSETGRCEYEKVKDSETDKKSSVVMLRKKGGTRCVALVAYWEDSILVVRLDKKADPFALSVWGEKWFGHTAQAPVYVWDAKPVPPPAKEGT